MKLECLDLELSVAKLPDLSRADPAAAFLCLTRTPSEISLVCLSDDVPDNAVKVEAGWRAFRVAEQLGFGEVGVLARLAGALAERGIPIFAISTFDTDYIMVKSDRLDEAKEALSKAGNEIN